ncbi:retrotransposon protein, putative, ty1-copia subclass [Tanacetum coccineum]
MVRSMMSLTTLLLSFWDYALVPAARILNMVLTKKVDKTPYELWHGKVPNVSYLKVWGCEAHVKRHTPDKLQQRSVKCIFVGYPKETMRYYFYYPPENKIVVERYADFLEKDFILQKESGRNVELDDEDILPSENTSEHPIEEESLAPIVSQEEDVVPVRRYVRTHKAPNRLCLNVEIDPDRLSFNIEVEEHSLGDLNEPANYKAALSDPEFEKWLVAMNEEMQSMNDNKVWKLVVLPPNAKVVKSKWIYKKKTNMDGKVYIYKARLVAKGFTQTYGVDYEETFSPVADIRAIRILIAIAAYYDYEIWQMDVKTAFLNGFLEEEIYMEQPKGFIDPNHPSKVCKLQRSIYGLKQASRSWNKRFDEEIKKFGFHQNLDEPCVYQKASGSNVIFLILYVDDIILMGNHIPSLQEVKDYLGKCFSMKDLGEAAFILGIKIYRDRSRRLIGLSQNAYLDKILKRYRMDNSKRGSIPMQVDLHLNKSQCATTSAEMKRMQNVPYASAVGSIMYAVRCTRPDVAFAQNITSRFQQNPGEAHWTAVKNILKYLRNTKDTFLVYGGNPEAELQVKCYCDAGFETDRDDTKSQTGYVFVLNGGAVVWKSSKQSTTAQHATEAEYIAASEAAKEAVWIRKFIDELGVVPSNDYPIKMNCDNSAAIIIAKESGIQKGARHFQRKYHYVRECIKTGEIDIVKVHTDENLADPFTKALAGPKLTRHARSMGLRPASSFIFAKRPGGKAWDCTLMEEKGWVWLGKMTQKHCTACTGLNPALPVGIGGLTSLQTLSKVIIGEANDFKITKLKSILHLRGRISIIGFQKVSNAVDAWEANLQQKMFLDNLDMEWTDLFEDSQNKITEYEVLKALRPHNKLRNLKIYFYGGLKFPTWVGDPTFVRLTELTLHGCKSCKFLPTLGHMLSLRKLVVGSMTGVKILGSELHGTVDSCNGVSFPSLQILKFDNMQGWEIWSTNYGEDNRTGGSFPCLCEISIVNCPKLSVVSVGLIPSLQIINIQGCAEVVFSSVVYLSSSILRVIINQIKGLTRLRKKVLEHLGGIEYLSIRECNDLEYLWELETEACEILLNLQNLRIESCEKLVSLGKKDFNLGICLKSIRKVDIRYSVRNCPSLDCSFPCGLWPPNLTILRLGGLKKPMSEWGMPNLPKSLVTLHLHGENSGLVSFAKGNVGNRSRSTSSPLYLPSSLTFLHIHGFVDLESLLEGLQHLSCLEDLHIGSCLKLRDLPETLLPMLSCLSVSFCSQQQKKCRSRKGNYWPIISRIPSFDV